MLPGPEATARSCRGAYRSRQSPAKPEHPTGPGSSAVHNLEHPRERRRVHPRIDDDPTPAPDDDLNASGRGRPGSRPTLGDDHRRDEARRRPFGANLLGTKRSSPPDQHRSGDPVSACRRRYEPPPAQALHNNPELLVLRPASASTRLDHLEPPELRTVRMTVHTNSPQRQASIRQDGPDRRDTFGSKPAAMLSFWKDWSPWVVRRELVAGWAMSSQNP